MGKYDKARRTASGSPWTATIVIGPWTGDAMPIERSATAKSQRQLAGMASGLRGEVMVDGARLSAHNPASPATGHVAACARNSR